MHGAIAENRSVYEIHEEGWPRETFWVFEHGAAKSRRPEATRLSRKKRIFRGALKVISENTDTIVTFYIVLR